MNDSQHLSIIEREKIMVMLSQGMTPSQIASGLGHSRSTISRELSRNYKQHQSYSANTAQLNYSKNRQFCKPHYKLDDKALYALRWLIY